MLRLFALKAIIRVKKIGGSAFGAPESGDACVCLTARQCCAAGKRLSDLGTNSLPDFCQTS